MKKLYTSDMERDLSKALRITTAAAEEAGSLQVERRSTVQVQAAKEHLNDLVSDVDLLSQKLIFEQLHSVWPDDELVGEEGDNHPGSSGWRWIVDPLDGTRSYVSQSGPWAVCIALQEGEKSKVAVVHDPAAKETFSAIEGGGAFLNGERIQASSCRELNKALLGLSFNPSPSTKQRIGMLIPSLLPAVGDVRRIPVGLHLAYLACGRLDCGFILDVKLWDVAAGALIAEEAGVEMSNGRSGLYTPELTLGATPGLASEFSTLINHAMG